MEEFELPSMYQLCLMHARADRAMRVVVCRELDDHSLTMMEWLALGVISNAPQDGFSMSKVSRALDVTLPQVTALVNALIKMKLIKRKILASDRRGRQVVITPRGERLLVKLEDRIMHVMRGWTSDVPAKQLKAYILTLAQLSANVRN